jgi:aminomethyltransferase
VDDILIYRYSKDQYLLVVNAGNTEKDFAWFQENAGAGVTLKNISAQTAQIALQGPNSLQIMLSLTDAAPGETEILSFHS